MKLRTMILLGLTLVIVAGCGTNRPSPSVPAAGATPTLERAAANATTRAQIAATATAAAEQAAQATPIRPTATATATATAAPTATSTVRPTATVAPTSAAAAPVSPQSNPQTTMGISSGTLLALNPRKYPAPTLLTPDNNMTYHVSQPVAHLAWSATPTELLKFGQTPTCVSDAINFRRAYESYQLVIHSLDGTRPDQVQWTDNNPSFDLNLTTVPAGRYSWTVNVVTLCQSYVVGERHDTRPLYDNRNTDPAFHLSTLQTTLVGAASPWSATRIVNWVP
jgi:hypothetical protein